jgi:GGDEF domain-containing protein
VVISLKGLIDNPNRRASSSARGRIATILLEGFARHAFACSEAQRADFESEMEMLGARFESVQDDEAATRLAWEAVERVESWAALSKDFVAEEGKRTRDALALLVGSLVEGFHGMAGGAGNLLEIEAELENTPATEDLAALNAGLRGFLGQICDEISGLRRRNSDLLRDLDRAARLDIDSATGLPGISSAVRAIRTAMDQGMARHIYGFRLENLEVTNHRLGFHAGDQVLLFFAQYVAQRLKPGDVLFRWRGPTFLAVSAEAGAAADLGKILGSRLEHSITIGSREVNVPVVSSWTTVKIAPNSSMDDVLRRLDEFALRGTSH